METLRSLRRRWREATPGVVVAIGAGIGGVAGSFAAAGSTPGFVAAPVAGVLARNLPSAVITAAILLLGDLGQRINAIAAIGIAALLMAAANGGAVLAVGALERRSDADRADQFARVALAGLLVTVVAFALSDALAPSLAAGAASALVHTTAVLAPSIPARSPTLFSRADLPSLPGIPGLDGTADGERRGNRRRVLASIAGTVGVGLVGYLIGHRREPGHGTPEKLDLDRSDRSRVEGLLATAEGQSLEVDGLEPLVSDAFYEVDINTVNPNPSTDDWTLSITGEVEQPVSFTYEDIRDMDPEHRFVTLRCVGEPLNGRKLDNALWTGVPVTALFDRAGLDLEECCVMLRAVDGYYEEFPVDALRDGFLAYGMNGRELPRAHGFPVRALVPGHWGEINVKWLTEIEVLAAEQTGYWEERGWHGTGPVTTVAKLHVVRRLGGTIRVAGHAYAGTRGVSAVEVSIDGGETWQQATLSEPLPGEDVWRQWTHTYDTPGGKHEVVVRAIDGTGAVQPEAESKPFPRGPSGWVSTTIRS